MYKKLMLAILLVLGVTASASAQEVIQDSVVGTKTLTNDRTWLIRGFVYVVDGAVLNIEPGTVIFGEKTTKGTLIIERGGKIFARGEADRPIVFTSQQPMGQRAHGDWGGIIICGRARNNLNGGEAQVEGGPRSKYGGNIDNDNSGVLQYVRIEFPGIALSPNNEVNGLTLGSVGSETQIDHVQVSYSGDDSYEWFGGNVSAKYLVALRGVDDDWDIDAGFNGKIQFGVSLRDPQVADISGSNGIEADNNSYPNFNLPRTTAVLSNMTIIGPLRDTSDPINPLFRVGAHLKKNTALNLMNSVIMGWPTGGLLLDGAGVTNAANGDTLEVKNTSVAGVSLPYVRTNQAAFNAIDWFNRPAYDNAHFGAGSELQIINPFDLTEPNFALVPTSPLINAASFSDPKLQDPFFTRVQHVGAIGSIGDWTQGWTNFDPQNTNYTGAPTVTVTNVVYANTLVGNSRDSSIAIIRNTGAAPFNVTNIVLSNPSRFSIVNGESSYGVAPNSTQHLTIRFTPGDTSVATATLTFVVEGETFTINLSGRGAVVSPKVTIETGSNLDFALVRVGESVQDRVIITNTGTADLELSGFAITGADASAFAVVSGGTTATLAPKEKHTVWISFSPTQARDYSAELSFNHNAGGSSTVQLSGSGIIVYGQDVLKDSVTGNVTLTNDRIWILRGFVYVVDGATLNIEPGTVIFGEKSTKGTLIIERGGKINAQGTPELPIVFTSQLPPGERAPGDWGGIIIAGRAPINLAAGEAQVEGGPRTRYGGNNPADNSGVFSYVRIEFPGIALAPNNEINGLTFGGVGSQTKIDHVQVSFSGDDSYEWFGGSVLSKYLISHRGVDDDWDSDFGWNGGVQFGVSLRDPQIADISGSNGIESDNNNIPNFATPRTNATMSNMTIIGPLQDTATQANPLFRVGAHLKKNTALNIHNSLFMGWPTGGILLDGSGVTSAAMGDTLKVRNTVVAGVRLPAIRTNVSGFDALAWFTRTLAGNQLLPLSGATQLTSAFNLTAPDFRPTATSPLLTGAGFDGMPSFFETVAFRGAFGAQRWDSLWANYDPNQVAYVPMPEYSVAGQAIETVNFGNVAINSTGSRTLTISNNGAAPLVVTNAVVSGSNTFTMSGQQSFVVVQRGSRDIELSFAPLIEGAQQGTLTLTFSDNTTKTIALVGNATGSVKSTTTLEGVTLKQNSPNPFTGSTEIPFSLDRSGYVTLQVLDLTGRIVAGLHSGHLPAGDHSFSFDAHRVPPGTYFYHLNVNGVNLTRSMMVTK